MANVVIILWGIITIWRSRECNVFVMYQIHHSNQSTMTETRIRGEQYTKESLKWNSFPMLHEIAWGEYLLSFVTPCLARIHFTKSWWHGCDIVRMVDG
jgi:hypothetical protein